MALLASLPEADQRAAFDRMHVADRLALCVNVAWFAWYYLGINLTPYQQAWLQRIPGAYRYLQLSPRDHGKTTIFAYALAVYVCCMSATDHALTGSWVPTNARMLLISKNDDEAKKHIRRVKDTLERNPLIARDFGTVRGPRSMPWNDSLLSCRRVEEPGAIPHRDATLEGIGRGNAITGGHFDIILMDDPIDYDSSRTPGGREQGIAFYYETVAELAEPQTHIYVIGTRKHWAELYQTFIDSGLWEVHAECAVLKWPNNDVAGTIKRLHPIFVKDARGEEHPDVRFDGDWSEFEVLWPERWTAHELMKKLVEIGEAPFFREYQNDPSMMKGRRLKLEWLRLYTEDELPPEKDLMFYMGGDLAIADSEEAAADSHADYYALVVLGVDRDNVCWLVYLHRGHNTIFEQVQLLKTLAARWKPRKIRLEKVGYQGALIQLGIGENLPVEAGSTAGGKERIDLLIPDFQAGRIRVPTDGWEAFIDEYVTYPDGAHDDVLDATYYGVEAANERRGQRIGMSITSERMPERSRGPHIIDDEYPENTPDKRKGVTEEKASPEGTRSARDGVSKGPTRESEEAPPPVPAKSRAKETVAKAERDLTAEEAALQSLLG
jgi:phage terminase large subunit-like protein